MNNSVKKQTSKKKKICIGIAIIVFGVLAILSVKWISYINSLNEKINSYSYQDYLYMGTSTDGTSMCVVHDGNVYTDIVSNDTLVFPKKIYEYWDFPLLWKDYTCVDYEYRFVNVDTKEEEVYRFKPFSLMDIRCDDLLYDTYNCYIEDGEKKIFYRYGYYGEGIEFTYCAFIYNFDTRKIEEHYEDTNGYAEEFEDMARGVQDAMGRASGGLISTTGFMENNMHEDYGKNIVILCYDYDWFLPNIRISADSKALPSKNARLYTQFPELEKYINDDQEYWIVFSFPGDMNTEELAKMFIEDGRSLSYEGVFISGRDSVDGEKHYISSYDEFLKYWDEDKALNTHLNIIIWPSDIWNVIQGGVPYIPRRTPMDN